MQVPAEEVGQAAGFPADRIVGSRSLVEPGHGELVTPSRPRPRVAMDTRFSPLHSLGAEAATPDGTMFGRVHGISKVEVWFTPGYYQYANDARVADKLEQLGRLLWAARTKEYYRYKSQKLNRLIRGESRPETSAQQRRREARNNIIARGRSGDGLVDLESIGLFQWRATIAPGTVPRVDEAEFTRACGEAAERLVEQHINKLAWVWAQDYS